MMKFNEHIQEIQTYEAGKPIELVVREFGIQSHEIVKLASNENPFGCSPKVQEALSKIVSKMALYPDDSMHKLKNALAKRFEVADENIIIGAGSDQIIGLAISAKSAKGGKILTNGITFAMYEIYAKHVGATVIKTDSQVHDLEQFYAMYLEHKPDMIFLCTPNNPTGDALDKEELLTFLRKIDKQTLVVVDGAYMEYALYKNAAKYVTPKELITEFSNVLYLGTFSKAYGLGGMRVGYGIASPHIIKALYKLRPPFNITTLSLEAASVALEDEAFVQEGIENNFKEMLRYEMFAKEHEIQFIESYANFITLLLPQSQNSADLAYSLLKKGMIVRDLSGYGLNAIRVTIGTPKQNDIFFGLATQLL
jgi:histidinol-phosphate aminotransferase